MRPLSESQREELEEAVARYTSQLTLEAAQYLVGPRRGLTQDVARIARLGVVSDPLPGHEKYQGMIAIPYLDKDGLPLAIRFHCFQDHDHRTFGHGKYNTMAGTPSRMYHISSVFEAGEEIHVTEGEFDCLVLNMIGMPAVAIPGANNFKRRHRSMLAGFTRIWVWGDPDKAGYEFATKLTQQMMRAKKVRLDQNIGDITDTYAALGAKGLFDLIEQESGVKAA